ncbi:MAG: nucleoside kinase, partial [Clostridia bacterium]|nr:nucleoside kinase [Clostridia bacterium]
MKNTNLNRHYWHVDDLVDQINENPTALIRECCERYYNCIDDTAQAIAQDPNHKIIMLSGPSGSGKTTTANLLRMSLAQRGIQSAVVSLDDFYLGRGIAPKLPNGEYDYETIHALNIPLLQECLVGLMHHNYCELPRFDFQTGKPFDEWIPTTLKEGDLIIFEGIHALNPLILDCLPPKNIIKLYVSVETTVFGKGDFLIPPREIRLARRMVRD